MSKIVNYELITSTSNIQADMYGSRAKCLQRLIRLGLPVPQSVALSVPFVNSIALGKSIDLKKLVTCFPASPIISVRSSPVSAEWGGPSTILNIGMNSEIEKVYSNTLGSFAARELHIKFIKSFAIEVMRLDDEIFDHINITPEVAIDAYETVSYTHMKLPTNR